MQDDGVEVGTEKAISGHMQVPSLAAIRGPRMYHGELTSIIQNDNVSNMVFGGSGLSFLAFPPLRGRSAVLRSVFFQATSPDPKRCRSYIIQI